MSGLPGTSPRDPDPLLSPTSPGVLPPVPSPLRPEVRPRPATTLVHTFVVQCSPEDSPHPLGLTSDNPTSLTRLRVDRQFKGSSPSETRPVSLTHQWSRISVGEISGTHRGRTRTSWVRCDEDLVTWFHLGLGLRVPRVTVK